MRLATSTAGAVVAVNEFDAFGALGAHSGTSFTIGYSGNWTDSTTKLVYLRARDYDPKTGQFLQVDPAVDLTRQPYAYAHNDPLARTDPTGLCDGMPGTPPGRTCDANDYFWSSDAQAEMWGQVGNNFANMAYGIADTITYNPALTPFGASSWSELWRHALVPSIECHTPTNGFHTFASLWTGGALGGLGAGIGAAGAAGENAGIAAEAGGPALTRVGRWMSPAEHDAMSATRTVQEGAGGVTNVAHPADVESYIRQAAPGTRYVEFDVPVNSLVQGGKEGWATIPGPNSIFSRLNSQRGLAPFEFPGASNIEWLATKLPPW